MSKLLAAVVLLACATTALAAGYPVFPVYNKKAVCKKLCKPSYKVCKDIEELVEECPQPVYVAPVYKKKAYHGRKLQNGCPKVKKIKHVCEDKPCTETTYTPKKVCKKDCDYHGRKLANYKQPYIVAPKCEEKCETIQVPETKCLAQCVYEECPKPVVVHPIYKPKEPKHEEPKHEKPDIKDIIGKIADKFKGDKEEDNKEGGSDK